MSPRGSARRRAFGIIVGDLRDRVNMKQEAFADRLGITRSLLAAVETGRLPPSDSFIAALVAVFPDNSTDIEADAKSFRTSNKRTLQVHDPAFAHVETLVRSGKLEALWEMLIREADQEADPFWLAKMYLDVNDICRELGLPRGSELSRIPNWNLLEWAYTYLTYATPPDGKLFDLWERLIHAYLQDRDWFSASNLLTLTLQRYPTAGKLWCVRAMMQLEEEDYSGAYASVTTALTHKASYLDVIYIRGLILTEWYKPAEAVAELTKALESSELARTKVARARSARAFALFINSQNSRALAEFEEIEKDAPHNAWLHYFRARYHRQQNTSEHDNWIWRLERAVECKDPPLSEITLEGVKRALAICRKPLGSDSKA